MSKETNMIGEKENKDLKGNEECTLASNLATHDVEKLKEIVGYVIVERGDVDESTFENFKRVISMYQEQPQLLDPILESIVRPLSSMMLEVVVASTSSDVTHEEVNGSTMHPVLGAELQTGVQLRLENISRFLWLLASVRGYKTVSRFMPNEATAFEPAVYMLKSFVRGAATVPSVLDNDLTGKKECVAWELQYVLLMWLSLLVMIPFDLHVVDSSLDSKGFPDLDSKSAAPIARFLLDSCMILLSASGATREMASVVIGRLLTRRDLKDALFEFTEWGVETISDVLADGKTENKANRTVEARKEDVQTVFLIPGTILAFATILKIGEREAMVPVANSVLRPSIELFSSSYASSNALIRKLTIKLIQRAALTFLPKRIASWRYTRGRRTLMECTHFHMNFEEEKSLNVLDEESQEINKSHDIGATDANSRRPHGAVMSNIEEHESCISQDKDPDTPWLQDLEQAELIECSIQSILNSLGDRDTVVRWSAAKGLGRIVDRLPKSLGDEVIEAVINSFESPISNEMTWHGGCLTLAEFSRRGLLLPPRLESVVELVRRGLSYDVRRGHCSVGANVRDAASYVCWAIARAYSSNTLGDIVNSLATSLITTAVFDREVSCRRAAAAAYQECVGRLGSFPYGIEILNAADYFTVSLRNLAYTSVAPQVASYPGYFEPLAWHLLRTKLHHWDKSLRDLVAKTLAIFVPLNRQFMMEKALPYLIPLCTDNCVESRHGAISAIAEILPTLHDLPSIRNGKRTEIQSCLTSEQYLLIADILPSIERQKMFRGKGGEVIRGAACSLIASISLTKIPCNGNQQKMMYDICFNSLHHSSQNIQELASSALAAFTDELISKSGIKEENFASHEYMVSTEGFFLEPSCILQRLISETSEKEPSLTRRGSVLALGKFSSQILLPNYFLVIKSLAKACEVRKGVLNGEVEIRVNAVNALARCTISIWSDENKNHPDNNTLSQYIFISENIVLPLMNALEDYTMDNRGDVGSWVREAAMRSLSAVLQLFSSNRQLGQIVEEAILELILGRVLRQSVERISRIREASIHALTEISSVVAKEGISSGSEILSLVSKNLRPGDIDSGQYFNEISKLLGLKPMRVHLMEGLIYSIGGLDAQLSEQAKESLLSCLNAGICDYREIFTDVLSIWARHKKSGRMSTPLLISCEIMISQSGIGDVCRQDSLAFLNSITLPKPQDSDRNQHSAPLQENEVPVLSFLLSRLLFFLRAEISGCTDIQRLHAAAGVLSQLALVTIGPIQKDILTATLSLIGNRYPKVRRYAAEQLYTSLLSMNLDEIEEFEGHYDMKNESTPKAATSPQLSSENIESAMEILMATAWDGPAAIVRPARLQLYECLGLPPPSPSKNAAVDDLRTKISASADENSSYRTLIHNLEKGL